MIAHDFDGKAVSLPSPEGGAVMFAVGKVRRTAESEPEEACMIKIEDKHGESIADFGMTGGTFGVLMTCIHAAFHRYVPPETIEQTGKRVAVTLETPDDAGIIVISRFYTIAEAEQYIAEHPGITEEWRDAGYYGIDAPEEMVNP